MKTPVAIKMNFRAARAAILGSLAMAFAIMIAAPRRGCPDACEHRSPGPVAART